VGKILDAVLLSSTVSIRTNYTFEGNVPSGQKWVVHSLNLTRSFITRNLDVRGQFFFARKLNNRFVLNKAFPLVLCIAVYEGQWSTYPLALLQNISGLRGRRDLRVATFKSATSTTTYHLNLRVLTLPICTPCMAVLLGQCTDVSWYPHRVFIRT
jgi:hypothetical protein